MTSMGLVGSVGRGGGNRRADVECVQHLLNAIMPSYRRPLLVDGGCGPRTLEAIHDFQTKVVRLRRPDTLIDPGGRTWRTLLRPDSAAIWAQASAAVKFCPVQPTQTQVGPEVPYAASGVLYDNSQAMGVLFEHLKRREGVIDHFYCDSRDLVTLGIGYLVDRNPEDYSRSQRRARALRHARKLVDFWNIHFYRNGIRASAEEIAEDWRRVFDRRGGASSSSRVARLRIDRTSAETLARAQVKYFADKGMYRRFPCAREIHPWIQMAIIDARWNPAKISPWGKNRHIRRMWSKLDPSSPDFDPLGAHEAFVAAWAHKSGGRYGQRVAWRNARFREGAMRMIA